MVIGFTGTQQGMTVEQATAVESLLDVLGKDGAEVHHGDCIGADEEFHAFCNERGFRIVVHPPIDPAKRAFVKDRSEMWPAYDYRTRNGHIVRHSEVLIATPRLDHEERRSGTWMTIRMAKKAGKRILIVYPTGVIHETKAKDGIGQSSSSKSAERHQDVRVRAIQARNRHEDCRWKGQGVL
jgi:hypothetical protein